jgi:GH35 family endo-1,4-beta-xylanase
VINEAVSHTVVEDFMGTQFLAEVFKQAKAVDPDAKMYINDFAMLSGGAVDDARIDKYYKLIERLIAAGAPIEGIGEQAHFATTLVPPEKMLDILDRFSSFKLPIQITELDIACAPDEHLQADYMRDFYTTAFSHPNVNGITLWGFYDGCHWMPGAGLWRSDYSPKPAADVYSNLVTRAWSTDTTGPTSTAGVFETRGFLGRYIITISAPGMQTTTVDADLTNTGTQVTAQLSAVTTR